MLAVGLRTPARFPDPAARTLADGLLARVRGGKLRASLEVLRLRARGGEEAADARAAARFEGGLWLLDERGATWSSRTWARRLGGLADAGASSLTLWVGGSYGVSGALRDLADRRISLSAGTLPSWLACLVAAEQVYRADTILRGAPYHHGG